jgi:hypothetical protein
MPGSITLDLIERELAPPKLTEDEALEALLEGARLGAYTLPDGVSRAVTGRAALRARYAETHAALNAASEALAGAADRLALRVALEATKAGAIPKGTEPGAAIAALEADLARLQHDDRTYQSAADKAEGYPPTIARASAGAIVEALDAGLTELVTAAAPHAALVAAVDPESADPLVAAFRADPKGYTALESLVPCLLALFAAGAALARLGTGWQGPADDGTAPLLQLARLAA